MVFINRFKRNDHVASVTVNAEPATTVVLAKGNAINRDNWMALHCPPAFYAAWSRNREIFNLLIIALSLGNTTIEFSCTNYHRIQEKNRREKSILFFPGPGHR